jgi:predicted site-specific integrase-resolvase
MSIYNVSEFAKQIGVSVRTLQRWDVQGKLVPSRTPTNRRIYNDEHLIQAKGVLGRKIDRRNIAYARVSSQAQKPDLTNQVKMLEQFCVASGIAVDEWVQEIGGGLNFQRPKFSRLFDDIINGEIGTLVIAHKDRLARFGFEFLEHLCVAHDCKLVVMNIESLSPEQEMIQDMLAVVHCFSARLYGLRNYRKALRKALEDDQSAQDQTESND